MRIVYVTSSLPYGPGEAFIIPEIEELKRQGHEVLLVPMFPRGKLFHEKAVSMIDFTRSQPLISWEILKKAICNVLSMPFKALSTLTLIIKYSNRIDILAKNLVVYPKGLWLAYVVRDWRAEHVHAHWAATTATMALVAAGLSRVPWSFTAHRWDIAENNLIALKTRKAAFARAIDSRGAQELMSHAKFADWTPHIIHMGVILQIDRVHNCIPSHKIFRVIMAANFVEKKGHIYLIEAVQLLCHSGFQIMLDLAGDGPLKSDIESKVKNYRLEGNVNFLGAVPHSQLISRMRDREWDLMVLPSIEDSTGAREGIPVSLMEAMSCEIPVISTKTGGIPELLEGDAGLLVPTKDPVALAEAIEALATDPVLREQLAKNGSKRVHEEFNVKTVVTKLVSLFSECRKTKN